MSKKHKPSSDPRPVGEIEPDNDQSLGEANEQEPVQDADELDEPIDVELDPDAEPLALPKSARQLRAEYEALNEQCGAMAKRRVTLEKELQDEVKARLNDHAGDLEAMLRQKRQAFMAMEAAERAEAEAAA